MLDSGRYFWTPDQVKEFIDILALHKMNRFHWHLTEDQGWRIEIKKYPELTRVGSVRRETIVGHYANSTEYDGTPYGGFYTQKEIREIVQYAADRFITVIPEIELPGHAVAALASYPWLGCRGEGYEVRTRWGISPEVYCPGKETTFGFLQDVFTEVLALFPSEYIHIGGDECPKESWKTCPMCQQRIKDEGLKDEFELQSYTVRRMEKWLGEHGRKIIGWDEILEGGVSPTATVMSWRGSKGGIAAAKAGNHVIMAPNDFCYLDYYQTKDPMKEPLGIGGFVPVSKSYALDPYNGLAPEERPYILGVQANLWTEYIFTSTHLKHMLLPRLAAIAEVGWAYDRKDFADFKRRMNSFRKCYDAAGYNYATYFSTAKTNKTERETVAIIHARNHAKRRVSYILMQDSHEPKAIHTLFRPLIRAECSAQIGGRNSYLQNRKIRSIKELFCRIYTRLSLHSALSRLLLRACSIPSTYTSSKASHV